MVHILFLPGTFGSTVNYVLQSLGTGMTGLTLSHNDAILPDGSMHTFYKSGHWLSLPELTKFFNKEIDQNIEISTPIYPMEDAHAKDIIDLLYKNCPKDKVIFIYVNSLEYAEINMLAQYYKIANGSSIRLTINMFCNENEHNIINWNPTYTHWSQMQTWELREWLSIFYIEWVKEWINAKIHVPSNWLQISSEEILNNTEETFVKACEYCNGIDSTKLDNLKDFSLMWKSKQQYLLDEYNLIKNIVESTISNNDLNWQPLNIIAEVIIQQKLRSAGYEIKCYNTNIFPTNAKQLHDLLERI
jgi:hypothetical protein